MPDDNPGPLPTAAERLAFYDKLLTVLGPELAALFVANCADMIMSNGYGAVGIIFERGRPRRLERTQTYEP